MPANSSSSVRVVLHCQDVDAAIIISLFSIFVSTLLLVPLSIVVLHLGHQRRQQRSSHSDVFAYHSVVLNLLFTLGNILYTFGSYLRVTQLALVGGYLSAIYYPTMMQFHVLTCVERYLAVVHPVTYLGLRQSGGVRIRNISIAFVWLQSLAWIGISHLYAPEIPRIPYFVLIAASLLVISFCSISVLCVLIRPGPGDVNGDRQQVGQSRRRAFNTMTAIFTVLWWFLVSLIVVLAVEGALIYHVGCLVLVSALFFSLPVSLVLPLLFMHRSGKLLCCLS